MVTFVQGDVLESKANLIAHGCNCKGGFGSGVAGAIRTKYPKARHYYLDKFEEDGWKLGEVQFVKQWDDRWIANCATQDDFLPRGTVHVDYDAVRTSMSKVKQFAMDSSLSVAIPKIGAGLAGGDWSKIESILNEVFNDYDVTVYYL